MSTCAYQPSTITHAGILALCGLCLLANGCVWHGRKTDYYVGPFMNRGEAPQTVQTVHFPLVIEGGHQWGITLGLAKRSTLDACTPATITNTESVPQWRFGAYKSVKRCDSQFVHRILYGGQVQAGSECSSTTIGYSSRTSFFPTDGHTYVVTYSSDDANSRLLRDPAVENLVKLVPHKNENKH